MMPRPATLSAMVVSSLMEVLYRVWKNEGEEAGQVAYQNCLNLPVIWIHESPALLVRATAVKAAKLNAILVHKDPELENLPQLLQERLPYK